MTDEPTNEQLNEAARDAGEISQDDAGPIAGGTTTLGSVTTLPAAPIAQTAAIAKPTKDQLRHLGDALLAELKRPLAKVKFTPAMQTTLANVAARAIAYRVEATVPATDDKAAKKLASKKAAVEAELANIKSIGSQITAKRLWTTVDAVVTRMTQLVIGAAVASL